MASRAMQHKILLQQLKGMPVHSWHSKKNGNWAVMYDEKLDHVEGGAAQMIAVKGFGTMRELEPLLCEWGGSLQAASVEAPLDVRRSIARWLAGFGVNRICRAGKLQNPPAAWHHDGKPNFAGWLSFLDLEK